jgi:hypothetical protein
MCGFSPETLAAIGGGARLLTSKTPHDRSVESRPQSLLLRFDLRPHIGIFQQLRIGISDDRSGMVGL